MLRAAAGSLCSILVWEDILRAKGKVNRAVTRHKLRPSRPVQSTATNFRCRAEACENVGRHIIQSKALSTVRRVNRDLIGRSFISVGIQRRGPGDNATTTSVKKRSYYQKDVYRALRATTRRGGTLAQKRQAQTSADKPDKSRKSMIRQRPNRKSTHLPHNNRGRHRSGTPCKSHHFSGVVEAADCTRQSIPQVGTRSQHSKRNFGRTHKLLEVVAVADSQADHYTPGTPAEAAGGSNLDQAVALSAHPRQQHCSNNNIVWEIVP